MFLKSSNNSKYKSFFSSFVLKVTEILTNRTKSIMILESRKMCLVHRFIKFLYTLLLTSFFGKTNPNRELLSSTSVVFECFVI